MVGELIPLQCGLFVYKFAPPEGWRAHLFIASCDRSQSLEEALECTNRRFLVTACFACLPGVHTRTPFARSSSSATIQIGPRAALQIQIQFLSRPGSFRRILHPSGARLRARQHIETTQAPAPATWVQRPRPLAKSGERRLRSPSKTSSKPA